MSALSPLDGRYRATLTEFSALLSEEALISARVMVEIHWLLALQDTPLAAQAPQPLSDDDKTALYALSHTCTATDIARIKTIEETTRHDVKAVEYWLREELTRLTLSGYIPWIHLGCTSEDINNIAYACLFTRAHQCLCQTLDALLKQVIRQAEETADLPMLARTHGQSATPTTLGKELAVFAYRIRHILARLSTHQLAAKINGAVGNTNALSFLFPDFDWLAHANAFIKSFDLRYNPYTTQVESKDSLCYLLGEYIHINTVLLDCCRDLWQYISLGYFQLTQATGQIGSSTMPHKINPIDFENAEGNLGIANALMAHYIQKLPISRLQRDLSDSTVMRNVGVAWGHSYLAYRSICHGLNKLTADQNRLAADLNDHWEVLTEAAQTLLRARGQHDAYEMTKAQCTTQMTESAYQAFVATLPLCPEDQQRLATLRPDTYIGLATQLAKSVYHHD